MAGFNIDEVLKQAAIAGQQTGIGQLTIQSNSIAEESLQRDNASKLRAKAANDELQVQTAGLGRLAVEENIRRTAGNTGTDLLDAMGLQSQDAAILLASQKERSAALIEINKKRGVDMFSDPLGWLQSTLTIDDDIAKYNSADATAADVGKKIEERNFFLTKQTQNALAQQETVTNASIASAATTAKNSALIQANEAERAAFVTNSDAVKTLQSMSLQQLQIANTVSDAKAKQIQIAQQQESLALSRAASAEALAERKAKAKDKTDYEDYVKERFVLGSKILFPNSPEKWEVPNSPRIAQFIRTGQISGELKDLYEIGEMNLRYGPGGSTRIIAESPAKALAVMKYGPSMGKDQQATLDFIQQGLVEVSKLPAYEDAVKAKNQGLVEKIINDKVREDFKLAAKKVDGPGNPYYLPPAGDILKTIPALQQSVFAQKVLNPAIAAGVNTADAAHVYALGLKAVQDGQITLNQFAKDYSDIYSQAQQINVQSKQFANLGLAPVESYNVAIKRGISNFVIDSADEQAVRRSVVENFTLEGQLKGAFGAVAKRVVPLIPLVGGN